MAFFCAGSSNVANRKNKSQKSAGSRPTQPPKVVGGDNDRVVNGSVRNPPLSTTIPHSNSVDLPHSRKMIVVREYIPQDNRGLAVRGGESVQVIRQDGNLLLVRNEWGKEGIVPSTHLFAPYTATRTRKAVPSNPIRPVASGSSVHDFDPAPRNVPMYPSHSAGRPRHYTMEDNDNKMVNGTRRVTSPPNTSVAPLIPRNDLSYNNNNVTMTTTGGPTYEQKYSPSSSSGVATGPSSPSFNSLHQSTSQENLGQDTISSSPSPNDQLSLSSIEEEDQQPYPAVVHPMHYLDNDTERRSGPLSSDETLTRIGGRATSESNLFNLKQRPLPPPPVRRNKEGVYVSQHTNHIYSTIGDDVPPPIPPRNVPAFYSASQGDGSTDTYSNPVDAISQGGSSHHSQDRMPHYRVRSLTDVRTRDVKHNAQYSSVFHGTVTRSHGRSNGSSHYDPESVTSDGSSRRSSKKSATRDRIQEETGLEGPREKMPRLPLSEMNSRKLHSQTKISKFRKCLWGLYMVTANFEAFDENEVAVRKGEHVSVWNQDDRDWYWIVKHASNCTDEGFVPSSYLREIVSSDSRQASAMEPVVQDKLSQPNRASSLKQHPSHQPQELEVPRHRPRSGSGSQEMRFTSVHTSVHRRSSIGSTGGGCRARLNSDSSLRSSGLKLKTPSSTSIEKIDFPESPPSSPPPPYSEVDRSNRRFAQFSLSQQPEVPSSGTYSASMHRTSSHGHVSTNSTYQMRPRMNTHPAIPPSERRRGNPPEVLHHPPAAVEGGTLV